MNATASARRAPGRQGAKGGSEEGTTLAVQCEEERKEAKNEVKWRKMKTFKGHSVRPIKEANKAETKTETELIEAKLVKSHTHTHK